MPPMKVHLGIHLRFAADVHNSTSTCVVQLVIHLCFAADVHISWLDSRSANVSPTRQAFGFCRGGTHKLARFELSGNFRSAMVCFGGALGPSTQLWGGLGS